MQTKDSHQERRDLALALKSVRQVELLSLRHWSQAQANILVEIILLMVPLSVSDLQLEKVKGAQASRCRGQDNTMMREHKVLERMHLKCP
jgi:hypothetical protein